MATKTVTFGAVGDIDMSRGSAQNMKANGMMWPFEKMLPALRQAQVLFGNFESVILPANFPMDMADPKGMVDQFDGSEALAGAGFDFMNLAANHILDGGVVGMFSTQERIEARGIATGGIGHDSDQARRMRVIQKAGLKWGFLCYCEDTNYSLSSRGPGHAYYVIQDILDDVRANRPAVDVLVVSIHADLEFMETPSAPRRENFRRIAAAGATIVLGHHPHVPQGIELIDGSLIAYSLGNFFFRSHSGKYMKENGPHTAESFVLLAEVSPGRVESFRRIPAFMDEPPNERPVPAEGERQRQLLAYFEELDRKVRDDAIVAANWRAISLAHLDSYLERFKTASRQDVLEDFLGRLLLVAENRSWVDEVMAAAKERWDRQASQVHQHHRPHFVMQSRAKRNWQE